MTDGLASLSSHRHGIGRGWIAVLSAAAWLLVPGAPLAAQEPSTPTVGPAADPQEPAPKEPPDKEPKTPKEKKPKKDAVKFVWVPHPSIRVGKQVRIDFRGRLMEEANHTQAQSGDQAELDIAKRRLGVEGELFDKAIVFQVSREMGGDKSLTVIEPPDT